MYKSEHGQVLRFHPETLDEAKAKKIEAYILVKKRLSRFHDEDFKKVFPAKNIDKMKKKRIAVGKLVYEVLGYNVAKEIQDLFNGKGKVRYN